MKAGLNIKIYKILTFKPVSTNGNTFRDVLKGCRDHSFTMKLKGNVRKKW